MATIKTTIFKIEIDNSYEEKHRELQSIVSDFHIEQTIIEEIKKEDVCNYYKTLKSGMTEHYNFGNLEIAEYSVLDYEDCGDTVVLTTSIIWTNIDELITTTKTRIEEIIDDYKEVLWQDDRTTDLLYGIEIISKVF